MIRICPSILNANLDNLPAEIARVAAVSDLLHLDVMDNIFVPNFTFTPERAIEIIAQSELPVDVHLMVTEIDKAIRPYLSSKAAGLTIHFEASDDPVKTLQSIRGAGMRSGLAIKPITPFAAIEELLPWVDMVLVMTVEPGFGGQSFIDEMLPKLEKARMYLDQHGFDSTWLQVDGGISLETIARSSQCGADTFVAGSAVYRASEPAEVIRQLRALAISAKSST